MPSSLIHLAIAKEVAKKIPLNEEEFYYGNIIPDYLKGKDYKKKCRLHFLKETVINNITKDNVNLEKFVETYSEKLNDSVSLGVYSHFIADHFWIENLIKKHLVKKNNKLYIKTKRGLIRNNRITIYKDYDRMANWLVEKYNLSPEFIKNVEYNGFFSEVYDLPRDEIYIKVRDFISKIRKEEMDVYSKDEVTDFIKNTSIEVEKRIKEIMKK